ncbi:uncharacterized protein LOC120352197 [Nilaparvata lugens]|uniref:uncharacterized protein LOC120352197 n=1 Tax=Nilaparvata lugens TaxID=108931 RepID=UPI00193E527F|nr:uncharacterized protein LOC120352197 [Nilaparvata lugens]
MTKADVECIVNEGKIWRCPPCSKLRRQSMSAVSSAEDGNASISQVIFMLEEAREDRKQMEREFNASFEFANSKIDDQTNTITNQTLKINECLRLIEDLKKENASLKRKVCDLETRLEDAEQREDKFSVVARRKVKRNLSTQDLGFQQQAVVYINESLSPARRRIFAAAREAKKKYDYAYLWVQNGKILMRKEQGKPIVKITSLSDLDRL